MARRERSFIFAGIISVTAIGFESERGDRYGREGRSESDGATALQQPNGVGTDDCEGSTASLPAYHSQRSAVSIYDVMIASIVT